MSTLIQKHQKEIEKVCREQGISYLALFGSHARGDAGPKSDIDMLVEFNRDIGLLHHADTQLKLEKVFNRKVDLVTPPGVNHTLKRYIQPDLKVIYENT